MAVDLQRRSRRCSQANNGLRNVKRLPENLFEGEFAPELRIFFTMLAGRINGALVKSHEPAGLAESRLKRREGLTQFEVLARTMRLRRVPLRPQSSQGSHGSRGRPCAFRWSCVCRFNVR